MRVMDSIAPHERAELLDPAKWQTREGRACFMLTLLSTSKSDDVLYWYSWSTRLEVLAIARNTGIGWPLGLDEVWSRRRLEAGPKPSTSWIAHLKERFGRFLTL